MGVWLHGCMGVWVHGCKGACARGCVGVWVYVRGCMCVYVFLAVWGYGHMGALLYVCMCVCVSGCMCMGVWVIGVWWFTCNCPVASDWSAVETRTVVYNESNRRSGQFGQWTVDG